MKPAIALLAAALVLSSCSSPATTIVTGQTRPATAAASVIVYTAAPRSFTVLGLVDATGSGFTPQQKTDKALAAIKDAAAAIGANGLLLTEVSEPVAGITAEGAIGRRKMIRAQALWVTEP